MSIWMLWKILGDLCLYFSVIGAFPTFFTHEFSFLWPGILCAAGGAVSAFLYRKAGYRSRLFALLIPVSALLFAGDTMELAILIPPVVYSTALILRGDFALDYLGYREFFRKASRLWVVFLALLCIASTVEGISRPWRLTLSFETTVRYGIFAGICGIILLRQLRLGRDSDRRMDSIQTLGLLGSAGGVILGFAAAEHWLAGRGEEIKNFLGKLLLNICTFPLAVLGWLLSPFFEKAQDLYEETSLATTEPTEATENIMTLVGGESTVPVETVPETKGFPWWLAVLILSVLLILLLRFLKLHSSGKSAGSSEIIFEKLARTQRRSGQKKATNRTKVRRAYREYLKLRRRKGVKLAANQTSLDILESKPRDPDACAAARLREIYLRARYDESRDITPEDVIHAQNALKHLRE